MLDIELTPRFPTQLEEAFANEYFSDTLGQVRLGLVLGLFLYGVFGVLDGWVAPTHQRELWFIRFAVVCPIIAACFAFTYSRASRRYKQAAISMTVVIAGLGIIAMTAIIPAPGSYLYYAGLVLLIVYSSTIARVSVPTVAGLSSILILVYVAAALWVIDTPAALLVNNLFFLSSSAVIGLLGNYSIERYARANFRQRREIRERTLELEQRTSELEQTNTQLVSKNRELAESRASIARSARRSELIFSALSEALPGTVLDSKYRVEEKIGAGRFGTVYRGQHLLLHHPVAIKVFRPVVGTAALQGLERFRLEAITACRIAHPNAVTVLDFDVSEGSLAYLVMELLQGRSLADEMCAVGKLSAHRCAQIMVEVCSVLSEAHAIGIIHRDIKPSNVFLHQVKGEELVKVIDFGIAKLTDETRDPELHGATTTGTVVGTPAYLAPERLGNEGYDGRTDVYAVGVMMFEALCGRLPFQQPAGGGYWSVATMNALANPPAPSGVEPSVPRELDTVVLSAMAKEPAQRPTAARLATMLRQFLDSPAISSSGSTVTTGLGSTPRSASVIDANRSVQP